MKGNPFIPEAKKLGYFFKKDELGVGYYLNIYEKEWLAWEEALFLSRTQRSHYCKLTRETRRHRLPLCIFFKPPMKVHLGLTVTVLTTL